MLMADTLTDMDFLKIDFEDWVAGNITYLPQTVLGGGVILNFLRKSDAFYQTLSARGQSYLISQGFRAEQIAHISGRVDTEKFRPAPARRPNPANTKTMSLLMPPSLLLRRSH